MKTKKQPNAVKGGRPAKFAEPSTRITLTLPDSTLARLAEIGEDRAKAIVKAVDAALGAPREQSRELVRFIPFGHGESVLSIPENRLLRSIPWISLVETSPGRFLIAINGSASAEKFEIALGDLLDAPLPGTTRSELAVVRALLEKIREPRRRNALHTKSLLVVPAP